jgi:hypothetical protein
MVRWHDWQFLEKDIRKFINHMHLGSLTGIQLIQLHAIGNSFSYDYRLCDIFLSLPIQAGKLYGLLSKSMSILCLLNQSIPRMT